MTPAAQARQDAGFSLQKAAQRARVCPSYLRRIELHGDAPHVLAARLANLYGCSMGLFLTVVTPVSKEANKGSSRRPAPLPDGRNQPATRRKPKRERSS